MNTATTESTPDFICTMDYPKQTANLKPLTPQAVQFVEDCEANPLPDGSMNVWSPRLRTDFGTGWVDRIIGWGMTVKHIN